MLERMGALVLAAGKGTRMHCDTIPKVMFDLLGEPMLGYVYQALDEFFGDRVHTVVGFGREAVAAAFPERAGSFVEQREQLGTGHALAQAWPELEGQGYEYVLVANGDTPLVRSESFRHLMETAVSGDADVAFMTITPAGENAFGKVLRHGDGQVAGIVEAKDFDPAEHGPVPEEVNAGVYLLRVSAVGPLLERLTPSRASGEYYVTDLVGLAAEGGLKVAAAPCGNDLRLLGINSPSELVEAEERLRREVVARHLAAGVLIRNPDAVRLSPAAEIEPGAAVTGPCEIYGRCRIASGVLIESHCVLIDSRVEANARVKSFSHLEEAEVGPDCMVGPYARLRPGAVLAAEAKVGNFVEMKKSVLGKRSKASHLTYLGDAEIGEGVNIGAGTITCNYDGTNKHKTVIRDHAFIGSNTALVAPVTVGERALVGAGSTITKDVEDNALAIARSAQKQLKRRK